MPQILDVEKLTDQSQKDFLINFATELYIRSLVPIEKLEAWMSKHTGKECHLDDDGVRSGRTVAEILGNIANSKDVLK